MPQGLTVLATIRFGEEQRLRDILRAIGDDINAKRLMLAAGRPHIDFRRSRTIHFARFAILDDPDRGTNRKRLLYSSNYDGDLDAWVVDGNYRAAGVLKLVWSRADTVVWLDYSLAVTVSRLLSRHLR